MSHARRLGVALLATCLVAALAAAPTAGAASGAGKSKANAAATWSPKAQSSQSRRTLARRISSVRRRTARAERRLRALGTTISSEIAAVRAALATGDTALDNKINVAVGTVTPILQQLGTGLTQAGEGLVALKAGVETLAAATTAGFGEVEAALTDIGDFLGATEYGIGQVFIAGVPHGGAFVVTPDIPDAVQQAQVTQQFVPSSAGAITLMVGVRSAESDGTGASLPAAHCRVTITSPANGAEAPDGETPPDLDGFSFVTSIPNAGLGGAPFHAIETKSPQTSTDPAEAGFPFGPIPDDVLTDLTTGTNSSGTATAIPGMPYTVTLACVDTSASADDPTA